jgi:fructose-1-phosphate kinase PfkB-like protein
MVSIPNQTRESFCLIDLDQGSVVESVVEGPNVASDLREALLARLEIYLPKADLLVLSGSLPPGLPLDTYSEMINLARRHGVQTLADIHSEPLRNAILCKPWLVKPNLAEFHELIGYATPNLPERIQASFAFCRETGIALALSMSADGLLLATPDRQWMLTPPRIPMHLPDGAGHNVIGCGDALVGALAYEYCRSKDLLGAAKLGLAAAHFNLATFGVPEIQADEVRQLASHVEIRSLPPTS